MTADPVAQLATAFDATGEVISAIGDDQWTAPTPCPEWDVRALVEHVVGGNRAFAAILGGHPPAPVVDLAPAYHDTRGPLLDAFGQPGALQRLVTVPAGTVPGIVALHLRVTELLVHGWDLARATRLPATFPEELAEQQLAFSRAKLADLPPGRRPFGPPAPAADGAPAIDRLAALLGRDVARTAG